MEDFDGFTLDEQVPVEAPTMGAFPLLKTMNEAATGEVQEGGAIDSRQAIHHAYKSVALANDYLDRKAGEAAARNGSVEGVEAAARSLAERNAYVEGTKKNFIKELGEITQQATDRIASANAAVAINNPASTIAPVSTKGATAAKWAVLMEEMQTKASSLMGAAGTVGISFTPLSWWHGYNLGEFTEQVTGSKGALISGTQGDDLDTLKNYFRSLTPDEKVEFVSTMYNFMKDKWSTTDQRAAAMVLDVVGGEEQGAFDDAMDYLEKAAPILSATPFGVLKGIRTIKAGRDLVSAERALAEIGAKGAVVQGTGAAMMAKGAGQIVAGASGLTDIADAAKLVAMASAKVLPSSITTATSELQAIIRTRVDQTLLDLASTVRAKNVRSDEALETMDLLRSKYDPNTNAAVHSYHPTHANGGPVVYWQAPTGSAFVNKVDAEVFAKQLDPTGKGGLRVVPDTTNTGYLVEEGLLEKLKLERTALEAEYAALNAEVNPGVAKVRKKRSKGPSNGPVEAAAPPATPTVVAPKSLTTSKPRFGAGPINYTVTFDNMVDKGIYQVYSKAKESKSDGEIKEWLKATTGLDEAQLKDKANAIRQSLKKLAASEEAVSTETIAYKGATSPKGEGYLASSVDWTLRDVNAIMRGEVKGFTALTSTTMVSPSIAMDIPLHVFMRKMGKSLGLDGQPLLVIHWNDLRKSGIKELEGMAAQINDWGPAGGWYSRQGDVNVIIMKELKTKKVSSYYEVFAHEYGHFFEEVWQAKYGTVIKNAWRAWALERGITGPSSLTFEALMEMRVPSGARGHAEMANKWYGGDVDKYLYDQPAISEWAAEYSEWFADNFAKWAFTDEVPQTMIGQAWKTIVDGYKSIVTEVMSLLKGMRNGSDFTGTSDAYIARMLNEHIARIKDGRQLPPLIDDSLYRTPQGMASVKGDTPLRVKEIQERVAHLDEEISAMEAAKKGLTHGWLVEQPIKPTLYKDLNPYTQEDISSMLGPIKGLGDWALTTSSELYANRVVGVLQSSRYQKLLTEYVRKDLEKLDKGQRKVLEDALVYGDKNGVELDIPALDGLGADTAVKKSYMQVRALRNILYKMRNDTAVQSLTGKGYNKLNISIVMDEPTLLIGRHIDAASVSGKTIFDTSEGKRVKITEDYLASNKVFYELWNPITIGGKVHRTVALDATKLNISPIETVIPYRAGEYKRIYSDPYFVKYRVFDEVDGVQNVDGTLRTHRTAATKAEGDRYVAAFNKAADAYKAGKLDLAMASSMQEWGWDANALIEAFNNGKFGKDPKMEVVYNRTEDDFINGEMSTGGSAFYQERGEHIKHVSGSDTNTASPLESLAAEISNTAYMVPITEWRDVAVNRWFNTVKDILPPSVQAMGPEKAFYHMVNKKGQYVGNDRLAMFGQRVQDYVLHEVSIATKEEKYYQNVMRSLSEKIEGGSPSKAQALTGAALRWADPVTFLRTVSFHSMLGGFNPVQLLVQGMNAFNAFAVSPLHGAKAAREASALRIALMSDNEEVWRTIGGMDKISALGLTSVDEFVETVRMIRRSGLLDGINSTALYGAEAGKWSLFNKWSRGLASTSSFFFNRGEEFSRLVSVSIAKREWQKANPGKAWWTDDALNAILERQDDLTQNMSSANMASWQKGVASIPMQFMQYNVKFLLNMVYGAAGNKRTISQKEVASLLTGHALMFGTAGAGLTWALEEVVGEASKDWTDEEKLYVQQGVVAGIINSAALAIDGEQLALAVGSRFNTMAMYSKLVDSFFGDTDASIQSIVTGASGASLLRFGKNLSDATELFWYNKSGMNEATILEGLKLIGTGSFSSLNNVQKAYLASNALNMVQSRAGMPMFDAKGAEIYLLAVGIPPASAADYETMFKYNQHKSDNYKSISKEIGRSQTLALAALASGDRKAYDQHKSVVYALVAGLTLEDQIKVQKELTKAWPESKQRQMLIDHISKLDSSKPLIVNEGK